MNLSMIVLYISLKNDHMIYIHIHVLAYLLLCTKKHKQQKNIFPNSEEVIYLYCISDGHGHHRRLQSVDFLESVVGCEFFWQNGKTPLSPSFITVYYVN